MPFKKRASIVDDEDLKDFDSFLNQSESSDDEFSNTKSKAILQQARLQSEISLKKREEEEKKLQETIKEEGEGGYDSDDLDKRLAKYIGTYDLKIKPGDDENEKEKEKEEEQEEEKEEEKEKGKEKDDSEDFEDYKKRLGLNLSLQSDEDSIRGSKDYGERKGEESDIGESMRYSKESLGEIREMGDSKNLRGSEDRKPLGTTQGYESDEDVKKKNEKEKDDYKDDWESDKEEYKKKDDDSDNERRSYLSDKSTGERHRSASNSPRDTSDTNKSPSVEKEKPKILTFAEFQRQRNEKAQARATEPSTDKIASPLPVAQQGPFSSPITNSPHPAAPPPQPTPRPVLASDFLSPSSPIPFPAPTSVTTPSSPPSSPPLPSSSSHVPSSVSPPPSPPPSPPLSRNNIVSPAPDIPSPVPNVSSLAPKSLVPEPLVSPVPHAKSPGAHSPELQLNNINGKSIIPTRQNGFQSNIGKPQVNFVEKPDNIFSEDEIDYDYNIQPKKFNYNQPQAQNNHKFEELQYHYEEQQRLQQENLDRLQQQYKEQQQLLRELQQSKPSVVAKPKGGTAKPAFKQPAVKKPPQMANAKPVPTSQKPKPAPKPPSSSIPKPMANGALKPKPGNADERSTNQVIEDSFSKFMQFFQEKAISTPPSVHVPQPPLAYEKQNDISFHQYPLYAGNDAEWREKEKQLQREIEDLMNENRQLSGSLEIKNQRLKEKDEEIGALAQSNAALSTRLQTSDMRAKVKVVGLTALTPDEQRQLQQELKELETLVAGYQKENERLCADLKAAQQALRAADIRLLKDTQQMQAEIRSLQDASHYPPSGIERELPLLREQLLKAQRHIAGVEEQSKEREFELRDQIDRLKKEKKELEAKYGGVDLAQVHRDNITIMDFENKMKMQEAEHKEVVNGLQRKLQWYVDNQALLTQNDTLIASQKAMIADLQTKLESATKIQKAQPSRANDTKRIKELEKKIADLESKKGGNIESLISAVHPESETIANLKNAIAAQSAAHTAREVELDKGFRALRQEHEKMKQQYEKRIKTFQDQVSTTGSKAPKAADVEAQIQAVRNHYQAKLKELQRKHDAKPKINTNKTTTTNPPSSIPQPSNIHTNTSSTNNNNSPNSSPIPTSPPPRKQPDPEKEARIRHLENELYAKNEEIRRLTQKLAEKRKEPAEPQANSELVFSLQQQIASIRLECDSTKLQLQQAEISRTAIMDNATSMVKQAQQTAMMQQGEIQLQLGRAEGEASGLRSRISYLESELNSYKDNYRDPLPVVDGLKGRIRTLEDEARDLREDIRKMREETSRLHDEAARLKDALTNAHIPPGTAQFRQLEAKLSEVEAKHKQRESDLQALLDKTRSSASTDLAALRNKHQEIIKKKNAEINAFRAELDHMLQTIATINNVNSKNGVVYFQDV